MTFEKPLSRAQAKAELALDPVISHTNNGATHYIEYEIPAGTTIYMGRVEEGSNVALYPGGGAQIFLDQDAQNAVLQHHHVNNFDDFPQISLE